MKYSTYLPLLAVVCCTIFCCSCASTYESYQVVYTLPSDESIEEKSTFSNDDLKVFFNLWSGSGDVEYTLLNLADEDLTLYLDSSFFTINNEVTDLYLNASYSRSTNRSSSSYAAKSLNPQNPYNQYAFGAVGNQQNQYQSVVVGGGNTTTSKSEITLYPQPRPVVPSGCFRTYQKELIDVDYMELCGLCPNPWASDRLKQERSLQDSIEFDIDQSPLRFSFQITYRVGAGAPQRLKHDFFVSEIINMTKKDGRSKLVFEDCITGDEFYKYPIKGKASNTWYRKLKFTGRNGGLY